MADKRGFEFTLEYLGYGVLALGVILFIVGLSSPRSFTVDQEKICMYAGTLVFLAGVGVTAYALKQKGRR